MEPTWDHGLTDGTDFCGCKPDSLARSIVFHEREKDRTITTLRVASSDADAWAYWVPKIFSIHGSADIPPGCAYLEDDQGARLAFIIGADLAPYPVYEAENNAWYNP